ncbi:MAG: glycosyltransferase [Thermodesulfobacteriota bacterium]
MKLLIVSYSYFPSTAPRALRWTAVAEYWADRGHSVDVVSARRPGSQSFEVRNGVRIHRIADALGLTKARVSASPPSGPEPNARPRYRSRPRVFADLARRIYDHTWKRIYWPDYACLWILPAYHLARKLVTLNAYDALVSVSFPFTSHVVGLLLRRDFAQRPWVCDIGDPFSYADQTPSNNSALYSGLNSRIEKRILRSATAAAVSNDETAKKYVELFGLDPAHFTTIPPLASAEILGRNGENRIEERGPSQAIRLVFLGILYKRIRDPEFLLKILSRLADLPDMPPFEVHFFGEAGGCEELFRAYRDALGTRLCVHDRVDRARAVDILLGADVLVNIGNKTPYQLPSKVIEYAATGKPILNIAAIRADSTQKALQGYPSSLTVVAADHVSDALLRQVKEFVQTPCAADKELLRAYLEPFRVSSIAEQYLALARLENRRDPRL